MTTHILCPWCMRPVDKSYGCHRNLWDPDLRVLYMLHFRMDADSRPEHYRYSFALTEAASRFRERDIHEHVRWSAVAVPRRTLL